MSTLIHDVSSSLKKSIVFFKYGLKLNLVKGERFDVYLADAIMDRISYDSYKINIESIDSSKDLSMREVYGLDPAQAE